MMSLHNKTRWFAARRGRVWHLSLALVLLAGCLSREVIPISHVAGGAQPSITPGNDYDRAAKAITYVMVEELKLPPIETVLIIYPSLIAFEAGLVKELSYTPSEAAGMTWALAIANCKNTKIVANGHGLSRAPWSSRIQALAHEMTHIAQHELGDLRCGSPHSWMTEGFAEWVAYKVVEAFKIESVAKVKEKSAESVRNFKHGRTIPTLSQISSPADWEYFVKSLGHEATYDQAFLAVDFLIEQKGFAAAVEYFKLFGRSNNRQSHFAAAFGEDLAQFERRFSAHLQNS